MPTPNLECSTDKAQEASKTPDMQALKPNLTLVPMAEEGRSKVSKALTPKIEAVQIPAQASEPLKNLLIKFNTLIQAPIDTLTKQDGWDMVADMLTYLTWNKAEIQNEIDLLSDVCRKAVLHFGSKAYLNKSGMNDPMYCNGFLSSIEAITFKIGEAKNRKEHESHLKSSFKKS